MIIGSVSAIGTIGTIGILHGKGPLPLFLGCERRCGVAGALLNRLAVFCGAVGRTGTTG